VSGREVFTVACAGGSLGGWLDGAGPPVLLLHGGPGLSFEYLDQLGEELAHDFRVAAYQQRGLEPSTMNGPFTIAQAVDDAVAVLDGLGWERALVVGHSWGGQLALRLVAGRPERVAGALAVDPLGVVGDGGMAAFEAEMGARTSRKDRERGRELDERAMDGLGTAEDFLESLRIVWPAYFADPDDVPPMPPMRLSVEAYSGVIKEVTEDTDQFAAALAATEVPYGVLAGGSSPMPWGQAARATAELSPLGFLKVIPGGGHFPWLEEPGCVREAVKYLVGLTSPAPARARA
jgi:pimeloyl-ACP methyl ester carboxylesterase